MQFYLYFATPACVKAHLTPFTDGPLGAQLVVAGLCNHPLVLAAVPVHQAPAQVVHTERLSATDAMSTRLGALHTKKRNDVMYVM